MKTRDVLFNKTIITSVIISALYGQWRLLPTNLFWGSFEGAASLPVILCTKMPYFDGVFCYESAKTCLFSGSLRVQNSQIWSWYSTDCSPQQGEGVSTSAIKTPFFNAENGEHTPKRQEFANEAKKHSKWSKEFNPTPISINQNPINHQLQTSTLTNLILQPLGLPQEFRSSWSNDSTLQSSFLRSSYWSVGFFHMETVDSKILSYVLTLSYLLFSVFSSVLSSAFAGVWRDFRAWWVLIFPSWLCWTMKKGSDKWKDVGQQKGLLGTHERTSNIPLLHQPFIWKHSIMTSIEKTIHWGLQMRYVF